MPTSTLVMMPRVDPENWRASHDGPSEPVEEYPGDNADDENQKKRYARVCGVHRLVRL